VRAVSVGGGTECGRLQPLAAEKALRAFVIMPISLALGRISESRALGRISEFLASARCLSYGLGSGMWLGARFIADGGGWTDGWKDGSNLTDA
jgi:hypothetical protein